MYDATYIGGNRRTRKVWCEAGTDYGFALQYGVSDPDVRCEFTGHADDWPAIWGKSRLFRPYGGDRDSGCSGCAGSPTVIEKHFTLDRNLAGPDHKASLEPKELKAMVRAIRNVEAALGDGEKKVSVSEAKNIAVARKSIVACREIRAGELLTEDNLAVKRPERVYRRWNGNRLSGRSLSEILNLMN